MKQLLISFFILVYTCAIAQTADDIINKHFEATGGKDKWSKVFSIKYSGYYVMGPGANAPLTELMATKPFKGYYSDFSWQGFTSIQAMREDTGWSYSPWGGKRTADPLSPNDIRSINLSSDPQDLLFNYTTKGYTVDYLGTDDVEGVEVHKLRLTTKQGDMVYYYIDTQTYNIIKISKRLRFADREEKSHTVFSDFRKTKYGIIVPFYAQNVDENGNEQGGPVIFENIEVNIIVDSKIFERPNKSSE